MTKKTQTRSALLKQITDTILAGKGLRKRIKADAGKPAIYSRNDGVFHDPKWQDDWIDLPKKKAPDSKQP